MSSHSTASGMPGYGRQRGHQLRTCDRYLVHSSPYRWMRSCCSCGPATAVLNATAPTAAAAMDGLRARAASSPSSATALACMGLAR